MTRKTGKERAPLAYAVFGPGRVGRSFAAWVEALGHSATLVTRASAEARDAACLAAIDRADIVAAALPDSALGAFIKTFEGDLEGKRAVHFSGALIVRGLAGYHPLYSFPLTPLPPETMNRIVFARQEGAPPLADIVPGAPNRDFEIADRDRAFYHALAVLSGNFAAFLWNETAKAMADRLGLSPAEVLAPYLEGVVARFAETPFDSLTGPVKRRDAASVEANLEALGAHPSLAALYRSFLVAAWPDYAAPPSAEPF